MNDPPSTSEPRHADLGAHRGELGALVRAHDWASTPLGPLADWPQLLVAHVGLCLDSALATFVWWGPSLVQIYNDACRPLLGDQHPGALGRPARETWGDRWSTIGPKVAHVMATGAPARTDDLPLLVERGGRREPARLAFAYSAIREASGAIAGVSIVAIEAAPPSDVVGERPWETTARRRAEAALRENEAQHSFLLQLGDQLRGITDPEAIMAAAAEMLGRYLGADRAGYAEIDAELFITVHPPGWSVAGMPSIAGRYPLHQYGPIVDGLKAGCETRLADAPGHVRTFDETIAAVYEAARAWAVLNVPFVHQGRLVAMLYVHQARPREWTDAEVSLVRDVAERTWEAAERVRAEQKLRASEEQLRQAAHRKDVFLAMLAHELRNPLAPIRSSLDLLRLPDARHVDEARRAQLLDIMDRQVRHMVRLVDDLLDVSRVHRGSIELRMARVTLQAIVRSAVEMSRPLVETRSHHLEVHLPPEPLVLHADGVRLTQVFANLLNNAAKYTPPGGHVWLHVTRPRASEVVVSVRDDGVGIAPEKLGEVFEMFTQLDGPSEGGGLGLGLTLVRALVELHGGHVRAHSEGPGRGTELVVRLPLAADDGADRADTGESD